MKKTKYLINGKEYDSLDQVPEELRALVQGAFQAGQGISQTSVLTQSKYVYNGKEYKSLEEMPPEVRAIFAEKEIEPKLSDSFHSC